MRQIERSTIPPRVRRILKTWCFPTDADVRPNFQLTHADRAAVMGYLDEWKRRCRAMRKRQRQTEGGRPCPSD